MANDKKNSLRAKAEKILRERGKYSEEFQMKDLKSLIEELNIYQIELEHQNDELREAQIDLENNNSKLADLYNNAPVAYLSIDKDFNIVNVNNKGVELIGKSKNQLLNSKFTEYIHPDYQDTFYHHHRRVLNDHKEDLCEIKIKTNSDTFYFIQMRSIPTRDYQTSELVMRTAVSNITMQKQIAEENFRQLNILKSISDSVTVTNLEGKINYWNRGAEKIFGYSAKEMMGKTPAILYPDMKPENLDYDLNKIIKGEDYVGEWKGRNKNGDIVWVNIRTSVLKDNSGNLVGFLGVAKDITKEKLLTEKVKQEAERTKAYFELAGHMMLVLDYKGNIADVNKKACQTLGCKEKEFVGKSWVEHFIPDAFKDDYKKGISRILKGEIKTPHYFEALIKTKQGDEKLMGWNFITLKDTDETIIGLLASGEDITQKKQQDLYKSQLASIVENSLDGIESMDVDGNILSWNKGAELVYGYKASEMIGKNAIHLYPGQESKELKKILETIKSGKTIDHFDTQRKRKDGKIIDVSISFSPLKNSKDQIVGISVITRDITEQKQADKIKSRLASIVQSSHDAIISCNQQGEIMDWNDAAEKLFGYSYNEIIGKKAEILIPEKVKEELEHLNIVLSGKTIEPFESIRNRKDGSIFDAYISLSPVTGDNNEIIGVTAITKDISDKKESERKLEQSERKYKSLFDDNKSIMLLIDAETDKIADANESALKFYQYSKDEIVSKSIFDINALSKELVQEEIDKAKKEKREHFILKHCLGNGEVRDVEVYTNPIIIDDKKFLYSIVYDITQQERNKRALKESELRYKTIFEESGSGILIMNEEKIISCNKRLEELFDYPKEQIIGRSPIYFSPEYQSDGTTSDDLGTHYIKKAFKEGHVTFDWKHKNKSGKIIETHISLKKIEINGNAYLIAILYDLTEIKEYQLKLKEKNEEILAQNEEYLTLNEELHEANEQLQVYLKQLKESEEKFKTAFKTSPDAVLITRLSDGKFIEINEAFTRITGYTEEEIKEKTTKELNIWKSYSDRDNHVNELRNKGFVLNSDYQFVSKKGKVLDGLISANLIEFNNEKCILSIVRDITERKQMQEALEKSQQKYRELVEKTHAISWEYNIIEDKWTYVSPQSETILGYQSKEWLNLEFWVNNLHPDDREQASNYCMECTARGENHTLEYRFKAKNNTYVWLRDIVAVEKKNGKASVLRGLMIDIDELKRTQIKYQEQQKYLSTIIQTNIDGFWIVDKNRKFIDVNDSYLEMSGYTREEFLQLKIEDIDSVEKREDAESRIKEIIENGSATFEAKHKRKDGSIFDVEISVTFIDIDGGQFVCFCRDITEKKKHVKQIRELHLRSRLATESAQIGIWDLDLVHNKLVWDDNMFKLYGVDAKNFGSSYEAWQQGVHPDDLKQAHQDVQDAINGDGEFHTTFRVVWPDKTVRHIEAHAQVRSDSNGKAVRMTGVNWDITDKVQAFEKIRKEEKRQRSILKLMQTSVEDVQQFLDMALSEAINITESKIGYIYYYNEERKEFILNSWSKDVMKDCAVLNPQTCYELDKTGIWGEAVRQRKSIVVNNYKAKNKFKKGYPEGHVQLHNFMTVPVFQNDKIVAVVGVANKSSDYNELDELQLNLLMDAVWKTVETKKAHNELSENEKKYRRLAENISDVIWTSDLHFKVTYVSPSIQKLTGDTVQQHLEKPIEKKIPKEYLDRIKLILKEHLEKEKDPKADKNRSVLFETPFYKSDGSTIWVTMNVSFLRNEEGKIIGLQGVTHDISKRKEAEHELMLKSLVLDQVQDQVTITDLKGDIIFVNGTVVEKLGYTEEELLGQKVNIYGENVEKGASQKEILTKTLTEGTWRGEVVNYNAAGDEIILDCRTRLVKDSNGKAIALCGISTDITEQKKIEKEIFNMASMLDLAPSAITIHDMDGNFLYSNKQNLEWHGYTYDEFIKINLHDLDVPQSEALINERIERIKKEGEASFDVEHFRKDGSTFPLMMYVKTIEWKGLKALLSIGTDITERKKAEEALKESEEKFRLLFENMTQGFALHEMIYDKDGKPSNYKFLSINPAFENLTGLKAEKLLGKNVLDVLPKTEKYWIETYGKVANSQESIKYENYSQELEKYFEVNVFSPQKDYFAVVITDTTVRKKAEIELENTLKRNKAILEANPDLMFVFSVDGTIDDFKAESLGDLMIKPEMFLGKNVMQVLPDDVAALTIEKIEKVKQTRKTELYSYTLKFKGTERFYESRLVPYGDDKFLAIVRDITQKQLDEINLKESKQKLKDAMRAAKLGSWELDLVENKLYWSEETFEIFELNSENMEPSYDLFLTYVHEEDQYIVDKAYQDSLKDKLPYEIKHRIVTPKGKIKYVKEKCRTVFNSEGKALKSFGIIQDITDLKKIELDLLKAKEKAEESDKLKSAFLANMSHEIRTPMNAILGFSHLLNKKEFDKEKTARFLNIINQRTKDLLRIIDDVIDISKIEANQLIIDKTDFSLNNLLVNIYNTTEAELQTDNITDVKIVLDTKLIEKDLMIHSDENRLRQVFSNLIHNALKFTEKGNIEFGYEIKSKFIEFFVKDTGIGIPKQHQEIIFERFRQADDSTTRKYGGTGLGLPICKNIIELLGGKIWVESEENKGTCFCFTIPLDKPKEIIKNKKNQAKKSGNYNWNNKEILVVEDDEVSKYYMLELLEDTGVNIKIATTGADALKIMRGKKKPDLVLLDINLPDMSGNDIVREIKKENPEMLVFAQSAYSMLDEIKNSMQFGFDDYITKPIDAKLLLSTINRYFKD